MFWIWLMALITLGLLGWFGFKVYSGGINGPSDASTTPPTTSGQAGGSGGGAVSNTDASAASSATNRDDNGVSSHSAGSADASSATTSAASSATSGVVAAAATGAAVTAAAVSTHASDKPGNPPGPATTQSPIVYENVASGAAISAAGKGATGHAENVSNALSSDDSGNVREMIKVLNLRESDATRLGIERDQFASLWQGNIDAVDASTLSDVRARLHRMLS